MFKRMKLKKLADRLNADGPLIVVHVSPYITVQAPACYLWQYRVTA